jgi:hypothetical protein
MIYLVSNGNRKNKSLPILARAASQNLPEESTKNNDTQKSEYTSSATKIEIGNFYIRRRISNRSTVKYILKPYRLIGCIVLENVDQLL